MDPTLILPLQKFQEFALKSRARFDDTSLSFKRDMLSVNKNTNLLLLSLLLFIFLLHVGPLLRHPLLLFFLLDPLSFSLLFLVPLVFLYLLTEKVQLYC